MSANLPAGIKTTATDKNMAVLTQPRRIASMANSFPMEGSAMFIEEVVKAITNENVETTTKVALLLVCGFKESLLIIGNFHIEILPCPQ